MNALKSKMSIYAHGFFHMGVGSAFDHHNAYPIAPTIRKRLPMGMATQITSALAKPLCTLAIVGMVGSLSGCSWNDDRTKTIGGVLGGVFGAVLGSKVGSGTGQSVGIALGATLGTMFGQDIAANMSDIDKLFQERTTTDTLEYGTPGEQVSWSNPDSGNSGSVTPGETYKNEAGAECRTFETTVQVDDEDSAAQGTACRMEDGTWQVVEEPA